MSDLERPFESARWGYYGSWREIEVDHRKYRFRPARADDGSWDRIVYQHETRNGWSNVGKKVNEGIEIGLAVAALVGGET